MLLSTPPPSLPAPPSHPLHVHPSLTPGSSSTSSSSSLSSSSSSSLSWTMSLLNHGLGIFLDSDLEVLTWSPQKYLLYDYQVCVILINNTSDWTTMLDAFYLIHMTPITFPSHYIHIHMCVDYFLYL